MHQGTLAAREDNARLWKTPRECDGFRHAFGGAINGRDAARIGDVLIHRAPQDHNTINTCGRFRRPRKAIFQRHQNELADGCRDQQEEKGKAAEHEPAAQATPTPHHRKPHGADQQG